MDSLSTAYDFTMRDALSEVDETERLTASLITPRAARLSVETLLDGFDAVKATYELAGRQAGHQA